MSIQRKLIGLLLKGYETGYPFVKELLQNADDAGASKLSLSIFDPPDKLKKFHPLFGTKILSITNDGEFKEENEKAIKSFEGTKDFDEGAIGRFGLGIKSVFHFCDAFFLLSSEHSNSTWALNPVGFFNPYDDSEIYPEWNSFNEQEVASLMENEISRSSRSDFHGFDKQWFSIWLPLRSDITAGDTKLHLSHNFKIENIDKNKIQEEVFGIDLENNISRSFPFLRNVLDFSLFIDGKKVSSCKRKGETVSFPRKKLPNSNFKKSFKGNLSAELQIEGVENIYYGAEFFSLNSKFDGFKKRPDWPKVEKNSKAVPEKGVPHGAVGFLLKKGTNNEQIFRGLRVGRRMFQPLGDEEKMYPQGSQSVSIEVMLHGYFFLDPTRRRLYSATDVSKEWNELIVDECIAPFVLSELDRFVKEEELSIDFVDELSKNIKLAANDYSEIAKSTSNYAWVRRILINEGCCFESYNLIKKSSCLRFLPLPFGKNDFEKLCKIVGSFSDESWHKDIVLYSSKYIDRCLFQNLEESPDQWEESDVKKLLDSFTFSKEKLDELNLLNSLLKARGNLLKKPEVQKSFQGFLLKTSLLVLKLDSNEKITKALAKIASLLESNTLVIADWYILDTDERDKLISHFESENLSYIPFPQCDGLGKARSTIFRDWLEDLEKIGGKNNNLSSSISTIASSSHSLNKSAESGDFPDDIKVIETSFLSEDGEKKKKLNSLSEIRISSEGGNLLKESDCGETVLKVLVDSSDKHLISKEWSEYGLYGGADFLSKFKPDICLNSLSLRQELVNKWKNNILSNSHQADKAKLNLRLLLHGKGEKYDEMDDLWLPGSSHCEKIIRAVMAQDDKAWTIINESFSGNLNASEMSILGLRKAEIGEVADYFKNMRVEDVSALDFELNKDERLAIYQSHLIFGSENFSALPIHEKVNGGLSSLDEYSFLDGGYRDIPQEVERDLKFFKKEPFDQAQINQVIEENVKPLSVSKALSFMISNGEENQYSKYICRAVLSNEFKSLSKEEKKLTRESKWIPLSSEKWVSPDRVFGEEFSDLASSILEEGEYHDYSVINKVKGKGFKDAVRNIGLNGTEALRELGVLITNTNCILGISKDAYEILNDDQQRSFFRILTQNSLLLSKIKTRFPLYEFIKRVISDEVEMDKILSFVQEEMYRVPQTSDMIHFLDSLREVEVETEEKPIKEELRSIFYIFFKEFLTHESFASEVLPEIKLVNQKGNWKNTDQLCFGEEGVAKTYLLEKRAFECFTSRPFDREDNPTDDGATLNNLNDYFRDWEDRVPKSIVGTFLALIACGQQDIVEYSESLLGGRSVEGLLEEICPDTDWHQDQEPFVSIVEREDFRVRNILGEWMTVQPPSIREVKSVFSAGSPKLDLNDKLNLSLQIIALDEFDDNEKLIGILRNSIMKLIEYIFEIENATECEKLLDQLCEKSQIGVEMAKIQAIDSGLGYLSNLTMGMERSSNGVLALLEEMEKAQTKKAEKSTSNRTDVREKAETEYREIESDVKKRFRELLETFDQSTPCEEEEFLIKAVRRKISEDCMYSIGSVPFEIFQNADDSVIQLDEGVRNQSDQFEIIVGDDRIFFKHRGRSINSWSRTARSMTEARELGYHADLGKMLFLNSSSKRAESEVTGQFGLGFKSIYLLGNIPKVASGDLFFEIRAGFYPRILPFDETEELRNLSSLGDATQSATVIEIPTHDIDPLEAIDRFEIMAPYLPLFGKGIREVKVLINEQETIYSAESLHEKPIFQLFNDERVLRLGDVQKGCVILNFNENGFIKFEDVPSIWVTGPTHENHPFGIMLNCSRVKLDIGRSKIHQSIDQSELAGELGNLIGKDLLELSKYFSDVSFQNAAGLEELDDYGFWESLWGLLTELRNGNQEDKAVKFIKETLWGESGNGPYPKLLKSGPYFPNGVCQSPKLLKLDQVQFRISEFFITEVLEKALSIQEFKEKYEKGFMVRESYIKSYEFLTNRKLPDRHFGLWELFELIGITKFVPPEEAKKLGLIFNNDVLDLYNREELNSLNGDGLEKLNQELKHFQFSSKSGGKRNACELLILCSFENENTTEDALIAKFAPDDFILHEDYYESEEALAFFEICSELAECERDISSEQILEWAQATSEEKKEFFCKYMLYGEKKDDICEKVKNGSAEGWLKPKEIESFINSLEWENNLKMILLLSIGVEIALPTPNPTIIPDPDLFKFLNRGPESALNCIYDNFLLNHEEIKTTFDGITYPNGQAPDLELNWNKLRNDPGLRKQWMILFIASFTYSIGRTTPEATRAFIEKTESEGWLDIFSKQEIDKGEWISVLDEFTDSHTLDQKFNFWFTKFPFIYKIAKYLPEYVAGLHAATRNPPRNVSQITVPAQDVNRDGSGLTRPPSVEKDFGLSIHFVLTEIARLKQIENTGFHKLCYLPKQSVRKIMIQLGCSDIAPEQYSSNDSAIIYEFVASHIGDDKASFDNYFSIPFMMIEENEQMKSMIIQ